MGSYVHILMHEYSSTLDVIFAIPTSEFQHWHESLGIWQVHVLYV
jgi:hypothetical protein